MAIHATRTISIMLKKMLVALCFSAALIFALIFFLLNGIKIKSFSFGQIYVSQLYIKLDKKLIVNIEEIKLTNDSKVKNSYEDLEENIQRIPFVLKWFSRIDIESLLIDGNHFKILFDNDHLYFDNKYVNISSKYNKLENTIALDLYSLYLKDIDLLLRGNIILDYNRSQASFYGDYVLNETIKGELNTQVSKEWVDFFVTAPKLKNLKFLKRFFRLDKIAEAWMYDNVTGDIELKYLKGRINTQTFQPDMNSLIGQAIIKDANIHFNKKVSPVKTKKLDITYSQDTLKFDLEKPTYKDLSIDGSRVEIPNLSSQKKGRVDVLIQTKEKLGDEILEITKAYGLNIPVKQLSGKTEAFVLLKIPYVGPMKTFGNFYLKDAQVTINNQFPFYSKAAHIQLEQNKVLIKPSQFKVEGLLDSEVELSIDISKLNAVGEAKIKSFEIKNNENELINLKDLNTKIQIDFNDVTKINLQEIQTKVVLKEEYTQVLIDNLQSVYKYSQFLKENKFEKGFLNLNIYDKNNIILEGKIDNLSLPVKRNESFINDFEFTGELRGSEVTLASKQRDIFIEVFQNRPIKIMLHHLDVYPEQKSDNELFQALDIELVDTALHLEKSTYYPKDLMVHLNKDKISFEGIIEKLNVPLSIDDKKITQLNIKGEIQDNITFIESLDKRLKLKILDDKEYFITLNKMDLFYETKDNVNDDINVHIQGKASNILINNKFKVLSTKYDFKLNQNQTQFELYHNQTKMTYHKDTQGIINIKANNVTDRFINAFFNKDFVQGGTLEIEATGKDQVIAGRVNFKNNKLKNLRTLNNIIILVNTSPALVNPFLAIPSIFGMVTSDGFNLNGYAVNKGYVDFTYNFENKFLNMYTIQTEGNSVDFDGFATFDFQKDIVHSDMKLIFMKGYSSAIDAIPGINYILLGDDRQISTLVNIKGKIEDPEIKTNVLKDSATAPLDVLKRIFTLPLKPFLD